MSKNPEAVREPRIVADGERRVSASSFFRKLGFTKVVVWGWGNEYPIEDLDSDLITNGRVWFFSIEDCLYFSHKSRPFQKGENGNYFELVFVLPSGVVVIGKSLRLSSDRRIYLECMHVEVGKKLEECPTVFYDLNKLPLKDVRCQPILSRDAERLLKNRLEVIDSDLLRELLQYAWTEPQKATETPRYFSIKNFLRRCCRFA